MTKPSTIADMTERYLNLKEAADASYKAMKELEYHIITTLRAKYPAEWSMWERGAASFVAEGVEVPLTRTYDADKVRAEFGEQYPDVITTETKIVEKVNGRKLASMWRDAAIARRLEKTLVPQTPKIKVTRND